METSRTCTKCKEEKDFKFFHKSKNGKYGIQEKCKLCKSEDDKNYRIKNKDKIKIKDLEKRKKQKESGYYVRYREKNKEKLLSSKKQHYFNNRDKYLENNKKKYIKNKDKILKQMKEYRESNKEIIKERKSKYYQNNKDKINEYRRGKEGSISLTQKLIRITRLRIRQSLKNFKKSDSTKKIIGCDLDFYKKYLESNFTTGMTWENHGVNGWHIDHIIPCSSFDFSDQDQINKCFHYTNTMPRWSTNKVAMSYGEDSSYIGNLEKGDKII